MPQELELEEEMEPGLPPDQFIATIWEERRRYVKTGRIKQPHPMRSLTSPKTIPGSKA
ncbi:MAG: hypothetical protein ACREQA_07390 [Candidatus Binatia bacterium]